MIIARVCDSIVSTHKLASLVGYKLLQVQCIENGKLTDKYMTVIDGVGAGIGEDVVITTGSSARVALDKPDVPVDAVIVGILNKKQS